MRRTAYRVPTPPKSSKNLIDCRIFRTFQKKRYAVRGARGVWNHIVVLAARGKPPHHRLRRWSPPPCRGRPGEGAAECGFVQTMRYFIVGAGGAPPRHGLWPRPVSPFQGALPVQARSVVCSLSRGKAAHQRTSRDWTAGDFPTQAPPERGRGPCEAWRGGFPRAASTRSAVPPWHAICPPTATRGYGRVPMPPAGWRGGSHKPPCDLFNQSVPRRNSV